MENKVIYKQGGKNFVANAISGSLYFVIIGAILGVVGSWFGFQSGTDLNEIIGAITTWSPAGIGFGLFMLLIIGGLIIPIAYLNVKLHKAFGDKDKYDYKFNKRPAVLAIISAGLVWLFLIAGINAFFTSVYEAEQINILDGMTVLTALFAFRIDIVLASLVGFAITGWLLSWAVKIIPKATDKLSGVSEKLTKI